MCLVKMFLLCLRVIRQGLAFLRATRYWSVSGVLLNDVTDRGMGQQVKLNTPYQNTGWVALAPYWSGEKAICNSVMDSVAVFCAVYTKIYKCIQMEKSGFFFRPSWFLRRDGFYFCVFICALINSESGSPKERGRATPSARSYLFLAVRGFPLELLRGQLSYQQCTQTQIYNYKHSGKKNVKKK